MEPLKHDPEEDRQVLTALVTMRMPFGKYKGCLLCDIPEPYLVWFNQKGFPGGRLGNLLAAIYEIKLNGLEYLLKPLRKQANPPGAILAKLD